MKKRLLIVGCGDVALRAAPLLARTWRLFGLTRSPERRETLRAHGIVPLAGDLDRPSSLARLAGLAHAVAHLAPPGEGVRDSRTAHLLAALAKGRVLPRRLVYVSTTGVYGDCRGEIVPETRPLRPQSERALRRCDAERQVREWGRRNRVAVSILRVPGIYSGERLPLARLKAGTPALIGEEDAYTGHVHADDLARILAAALRRARPARAYNASDDTRMKMGDYFDLVARRFGLPCPPRITLEQAQRTLPGNLLSFMKESRRLENRRIKRELRVSLRYPTVEEGVAAARSQHGAGKTG